MPVAWPEITRPWRVRMSSVLRVQHFLVRDGQTGPINAITAVYDPKPIVVGVQISTPLTDLMVERTHLFGKSRYGVCRVSPKFLVSEILSNKAAFQFRRKSFTRTFFENPSTCSAKLSVSGFQEKQDPESTST